MRRVTRSSATEKLEIIRIVEGSSLPVQQTLVELDIPQAVREQVVQIALEYPEPSPRELAWHIIDHEGHFISGSCVYHILKRFDLITSPAFILFKARDKFPHPTQPVNEL